MNYPVIDPVLLSLGPFQVRWYGMMYLIGILAAWWLGKRRARQPIYPIQANQVDDLFLYITLGIILGGRIGYTLFYGWEFILQDPLWVFRVWEGGMSFHGGYLGTILALLIYSRRIGKHPADLLDFICPLAPIGIGLVRIANFIGQELWGRPTDAPWGMVFPADPTATPRHPSQLYEAVLEGALIFVILYTLSMKPRPRWMICSLFTLLYGALRFIVEITRMPDAHIGFQALGMTRGQWLCVPMILIGGGIFIYSLLKPRYSVPIKN